MRDEGKKRILVADDNQEIVDIVDILLTGEGYEVVKASNGQEAVELADALGYDIVWQKRKDVK